LFCVPILKEAGYHNWRNNLERLCLDANTLFSVLPSDILPTISKCLQLENKSKQATAYQKYLVDTESLLNKNGWFRNEPDKVKTVSHKLFTYEIGVEKYLATEVLFEPSYFLYKVRIAKL
jgi:hypothetical protein